MATSSSLLQLPRELRDEILGHALDDGGYIYNNASGKLRTANDEPINLALTLVCKRIALEVTELLFKRNPITVSTSPPGTGDLMLPDATKYDETLVRIDEMKINLLLEFPHCVSLAAYDRAYHQYPRSRHQLRTMENICSYRKGCLGEVDNCHNPASADREWIGFLFLVVREHPDFDPESAGDSAVGFLSRADVARLYKTYCRVEQHFATFEPVFWDILSHSQIEAIENVFGSPFLLNYPAVYSPVALFIRLMRRIPREKRQHIHRVVLEDLHLGAASPECHGRGLIQLYKLYPRLRIDRRASISGAVLNTCQILELWREHFSTTSPYLPLRAPRSAVTRTMTSWIEEAMDLEAEGIPSDAFQLTFTDVPEVVDKACAILEEVVWHLAFQQRFADALAIHPHGSVTHSNGSVTHPDGSAIHPAGFARTGMACFHVGTHPVASVLAEYLPRILKGDTCVRFEGCHKDSLDAEVEALLEQYKGFETMEEWNFRHDQMSREEV